MNVSFHCAAVMQILAVGSSGLTVGGANYPEEDSAWR